MTPEPMTDEMLRSWGYDSFHDAQVTGREARLAREALSLRRTLRVTAAAADNWKRRAEHSAEKNARLEEAVGVEREKAARLVEEWRETRDALPYRQVGRKYRMLVIDDPVLGGDLVYLTKEQAALLDQVETRPDGKPFTTADCRGC